RNAQTGYGGENVWPEHRGVPGDRRAPVMTNDNRLFLPRCGNQRDHVAYIIEDGVSGGFGRRAGPPETPHIRRHDMETGSSNRGDMMTRGIGTHGPSMAKAKQ